MKITINQKQYNWKFGFRAIQELETLEGRSSSEIAKTLETVGKKGIPFGLISNIAWCGLRQENTITKEEVLDLLDNNGVELILEFLKLYGDSIKGYMAVPNAQGQA